MDSPTVRPPRGKQDYQWLINLGSNSGSGTTLLFALREVISSLGASASTSVKAGIIKPMLANSQGCPEDYMK